MLSARGSSDMSQILAEVVDSQPHSLKRVVTVATAEKVWAATCKVLRSQLIQGYDIVLPNRTCGFYYTSRVVVKDADVKYTARTLHFGFHAAFITKFSLDTTIPRLDGAAHNEVKLPLEYIADECGKSVEFVNTLLREIWLWLGEALFRGRLLRIDFDNVLSVLIKREKAVVSMSEGLRDDLFAIDSRKWPLAVRDLAAPIVLRPQSARPESRRSNSSRPSSAASRPSSAKRPPSASRPPTGASSTAEVETNKAAFVSSAASGKLFADLHKVRARRPSSRQLAPGQRKPLKAQARGAGPTTGEQLDRLAPRHLDAAELQYTRQAHSTEPTPRAMLGELGENEEESIYSVLSPARQHDPMAAPTLQPGERNSIPRMAPDQDLDDNDDDVDAEYNDDANYNYDLGQGQQGHGLQYHQYGDSNFDVSQGFQPNQRWQPDRPGSRQGAPVAIAIGGEAEEADGDEDLDRDESKHVHFQSPTQAQVVEAEYSIQTNTSYNNSVSTVKPGHWPTFYTGDTAPERPGSGRRRVQSRATLATVRSLLSGQ